MKHAVLAVGAVFILLPFAVMISTSFKSPADIASGALRLFPTEHYGFANYAEALSATPLLRYMANGVV
ncbi:MAG: carbohydrate ABC transporter permease, partial [Pseudomonadota bacterium]